MIDAYLKTYRPSLGEAEEKPLKHVCLSRDSNWVPPERYYVSFLDESA